MSAKDTATQLGKIALCHLKEAFAAESPQALGISIGLLRELPFTQLEASLQEAAQDADAKRRERGLDLLFFCGDEKQLSFLETRLGKERKSSIKTKLSLMIAEWKHDPISLAPLEPQPAFEELDNLDPFAPEMRIAYETFIRSYIKKTREIKQQTGGTNPKSYLLTIDEGEGYRYMQLLITLTLKEMKSQPRRFGDYVYGNTYTQEFGLLFDVPEMTVLQMLRFLAFFEAFFESDRNWESLTMVDRGWQYVKRYERARDLPLCLDEVALAIEAMGYPKEQFAREVLAPHTSMGGWLKHLRAEDIWPFFTHYPHILAEGLGLRVPRSEFDMARLFGVLKAMPALPESFLEPCWALAFAKQKSTREPAQQCLDSHIEDIETRIKAMTKHKNKHQSAVATEWLARRR